MTTAKNDTPTNLLFRYGGFMAGYQALDWSGGRLMYGSSPAADEAPNIRIETTDVQWQAFAWRLSELGVRSWRREYVDPDVLDGAQWELAIASADGRQVSASGSNSFPPSFDEFLTAVAELTGMRFRK